MENIFINNFIISCFDKSLKMKKLDNNFYKLIISQILSFNCWVFFFKIMKLIMFFYQGINNVKNMNKQIIKKSYKKLLARMF